MKKLFTAIIILAAITATAQNDGYNQTEKYYQEVKQKVMNISGDTSMKLSSDFTDNIEQRYTYLKKKANKLELVEVFRLRSETSVNYISYVNLTFWYRLNDDGTYSLQKVMGNEETLIALWQELFLPEATYQQITTMEEYRVFKGFNTKIHYRLVEKDGYWVIENRQRD